MRVFPIFRFLTGKAFIHRTEKLTMLAMRSLWGYLKVVVVTMHLVLSLNVQMDISISVTCYLDAEVFTTKFRIRFSIVFSKSMSLRKVCNIMPLLEYIFIIRF